MRPYFKINSRNRSLEIGPRWWSTCLACMRGPHIYTHKVTIFLCPLELGGTLGEYSNINIASPGMTLKCLILLSLRSKLLWTYNYTNNNMQWEAQGTWKETKEMLGGKDRGIQECQDIRHMKWRSHAGMGLPASATSGHVRGGWVRDEPSSQALFQTADSWIISKIKGLFWVAFSWFVTPDNQMVI